MSTKEGSNFKSKGQRLPPNCLGYALKELGLSPNDNYVEPGSVDVGRVFERVETSTEAEAIGAFYKVSVPKGSRPIEILSHIGVVDSPGYVRERPSPGAGIRRVTVDEAFKHLLTNLTGEHELVYLKKKRRK